MARIDAEGTYFILRAKTNIKYEIVSNNFNFNPNTGVLDEHIIRLTGYKPWKDYSKDLRPIEFCDMESSEEPQFITNITDQLELNGLEIANIFRHRWDIESFYKLIKVNLIVNTCLAVRRMLLRPIYEYPSSLTFCSLGSRLSTRVRTQSLRLEAWSRSTGW